jgi:hypothetical protein
VIQINLLEEDPMEDNKINGIIFFFTNLKEISCEGEESGPTIQKVVLYTSLKDDGIN